MHRLLATVLILAAGSTAEAQPRKLEPAKFGWLTDFDAAKAKAKQTGKPIMLVFRCEP